MIIKEWHRAVDVKGYFFTENGDNGRCNTTPGITLSEPEADSVSMVIYLGRNEQGHVRGITCIFDTLEERDLFMMVGSIAAKSVENITLDGATK